jgi:hypothetical protein
MSILVLTSDTLIGTPASGNLEYNGQFFGTDSNSSRAQLQRLTLSTAVASTSGTSIIFPGIPAWVERITVMLKNVSTNGTSNKQIQLGTSGGVVATGYQSSSSLIFGSNSCTLAAITTGFLIRSDVAADELSGHYVFTAFGGNSWIGSSIVADQSTNRVWQGAGRIDLGGTLDRIRITTVNGTDAFDVGSINILYEG